MIEKFGFALDLCRQGPEHYVDSIMNFRSDEQ